MTPAFQFRQEVFSLTSVSSYILTFALSPKDFQISIIDPASSRCLWLEEFGLTETASEEEYLAQIQDIIGQHPLAGKTFWKSVRLVISNQSFTLVPTPLFQKEYAARVLSLARGLAITQESVQHTTHPHWEAVNVFSLPTQLSEWILEIYPLEKIQIFHQADILLELASQLGEQSFMIYFEKQAATLIYVQENRLHYCNRFVYRVPADVVYYVLFVMNELQINAEEVPAWAFGVIDESDEAYQLLYNHIRHLSAGLPEEIHLPKISEEQSTSYRVATLLN